MKFYICLLLFLIPLLTHGQGRLGINTDTPIVQLDVRALSNNENTMFNLSTPDGSYFTRLLSGHSGFEASSLTWTTGIPFNFGMWDGMSFTQVMQLSPLQRVGINTFSPLYDLDVRGTNDATEGADLQLATPGETNLLRLYSGSTTNRRPFVAFHDLDTFYIASTSADWSTFQPRVAVLPSGNVGIGTGTPEHQLTVVTAVDGDTAVYGASTSFIDEPSIGVFGFAPSFAGTGVKGVSGSVGVHGEASGIGVRGTGQIGVDGYTDYSGDGAIGLKGTAANTIGISYGVIGRSYSDQGFGVYGNASSSSGHTFGVYGRSSSPNGRGVYGEARLGVEGESQGYADGVGVKGISDGAEGIGVHGLATGTTSLNYGVYGQTLSTEGSGVKGTASASSGAAYGVEGSSGSNEGRGVSGYASSSTGSTYGVWGRATSTSGHGVYGIAAASSGTTYGVRGEASSTSGRGMLGVATASTGFTYGVRGESSSTTGRGVYGKATASTGASYGVYGLSESSEGFGVHAKTNSSAIGAHALHATSGGGSSYAGYLEGRVKITGTLVVEDVPFGDYANMQYNTSTGQLYYDNSSRRYKENVETLSEDFSQILNATPVQYTRPGTPGRVEIGYIAEDMADLGLKHLVSYDKAGEVENFNYEKMILYVVEVLKDQQKTIEGLRAELAELKSQK